ncbi:hypothetical protein HZA97_03310 [Candidatus Woesearchaeota archaeon]|nr:hypothetical protein [Candidatus Woesearchaeota archaeon]
MTDFMRSSRGNSGLGGLAKAGIVAGVLFVGSILGYNICTTYVRPGEVAVKINKMGGGIEQKVYGPGVYLAIPGVHEFKRFPNRLQFLDSGVRNGGSDSDFDSLNYLPPLTVDLSDGGKVECDYTIVYRIGEMTAETKERKAALEVLQKIGPGKLFEQTYVAPRATELLRKYLGQLKAEEFYKVPEGDPNVPESEMDKTPLRESKIQEAKVALKTELKDLGIDVIEVLFRFFRYSDQYQDSIEKKILQEQLKLTAAQQVKVAEQKALADQKTAEWLATAQVKVKEAEAESQKIIAQAQSYQRQKRAEGDLVVKQAEATGKEMISQSLNGEGGERVAALKAVEMLRDLDVFIFDSSNTDIFDTASIIEKLEGKTKKTSQPSQGGN